MKLFVVRLRRSGTWRKPTYDVVVAFKDKRVGGAFFEKLGFYSPSGKTKLFFINFSRLSLWLGKGATVTTKVGFLLGKLTPGIFLKKHNGVY